jgi:hypothetical protein
VVVCYQFQITNEMINPSSKFLLEELKVARTVEIPRRLWNLTAYHRVPNTLLLEMSSAQGVTGVPFGCRPRHRQS